MQNRFLDLHLRVVTLLLKVNESGFGPMMYAVAPVSDSMTVGWEVVHKILKEIFLTLNDQA